MTEFLIAGALFTLIMIPTVQYLTTFFKSFQRANFNSDASEKLRQVHLILDMDINKAVKVASATANELIIFQDFTEHPGYTPTGLDPFNIPMRISPDLDGDETVVPSSFTLLNGVPGECCVGNNLNDDDDNGDNKIDVRVRFRFSGTQLIRDVSYDEGGWNNAQVLAHNLEPIPSSFTYYGSIGYMAGTGVVPETVGAAAGYVTATEIDVKLGDGGGTLNLQRERNWISVIQINLQIKPPRPEMGNPSARAVLTPPLLPIKKKIPWP